MRSVSCRDELHYIGFGYLIVYVATHDRLGGTILQATLRRNIAPDPRLDPEQARASLSSTGLSVNSEAIFLGRSYFGCVATILPDVSRGLSKQVGCAVNKP